MSDANRYRVIARTNEIGGVAFDIIIDETVVGFVHAADMMRERSVTVNQKWIKFYLHLYEAGRFRGFLDSFKEKGLCYNTDSDQQYVVFDVCFSN